MGRSKVQCLSALSGEQAQETGHGGCCRWDYSDRSILRNDCENCQETLSAIARDRSDCSTPEQRREDSVTRPTGSSDGSKTQEDRNGEQSVERGGRFYQLRGRFQDKRHHPRRILLLIILYST